LQTPLSTLTAFGLLIEADFMLATSCPRGEGARPHVRARLAGREDHAALASGIGEIVWTARFGDGRQVVAARLPDGGFRLDYGDEARFVLAPAADSVIVEARRPEALEWQRFLLDTVAWWLALVHGRHLLHAAVVEVGGRLVAILAPSGGGKTTLAAELVLGGGRLFSDDLLCLDDAATAHPGPPLMNLPASRQDAERLGVVLARFASEDELWIRPHRTVAEPGRIGLLLLLDRRAGQQLGVEPVALTALDLFGHVWALPAQEAISRERFGALSTLAQEAAAYHLRAAPTDGPGDIAAVVADLVAGSASPLP
jgi:hypothetical protein